MLRDPPHPPRPSDPLGWAAAPEVRLSLRSVGNTRAAAPSLAFGPVTSRAPRSDPWVKSCCPESELCSGKMPGGQPERHPERGIWGGGPGRRPPRPSGRRRWSPGQEACLLQVLLMEMPVPMAWRPLHSHRATVRPAGDELSGSSCERFRHGPDAHLRGDLFPRHCRRPAANTWCQSLVRPAPPASETPTAPETSHFLLCCLSL